MRFTLRRVMAFVAIAALDFAAVRAVWEHKPYDLLATGALPMANVLAAGLLIHRRYRGSRPFLSGFEAFGATALAGYIVGMCLFREELTTPFLDLVVKPYVTAYGPTLTTGSIVVIYCLAAVIWGLPQLAFAVLGGLFSLRFWASKRPDLNSLLMSQPGAYSSFLFFCGQVSYVAQSPLLPLFWPRSRSEDHIMSGRHSPCLIGSAVGPNQARSRLVRVVIHRHGLAVNSAQETCMAAGALGPIQAPGGHMRPHSSQTNADTLMLILARWSRSMGSR